MKRWLKLLSRTFGALLLLKLAWFGACRPEGPGALLARQRYLVSTLDRDGRGSGSLIGGEWELVALSMTALATANLAFDHPENREQALRDAAALCRRALEPRVRAFDTRMWGEDALATLEGPNGHIGYLGHLAIALGAYRALGGGDAALVQQHRAVISALARRMERSASTYLETYPLELWTADNAVVVGALGMSDLVEGEPAHRALLARHVAYTKAHLLDPRTGLVVFRVTPGGEPLGTSRGSGVGWNSLYLPFADRAFAAEQYAALAAKLSRPLLFGAGILEFPPGVEGVGDVDSGPVLLGVSTSGTGFALAGARWENDDALGARLLHTAELAGFTVWSPAGRRYLLAPLVGDAAVLAARTARPWSSAYSTKFKRSRPDPPPPARGCPRARPSVHPPRPPAASPPPRATPACAAARAPSSRSRAARRRRARRGAAAPWAWRWISSAPGAQRRCVNTGSAWSSSKPSAS